MPTAGITLAKHVTYHTSTFSREDRLTTSFSDLRYFLECPHDFYLRVVLGFSPTIDQAFGYGRGVHNSGDSFRPDEMGQDRDRSPTLSCRSSADGRERNVLSTLHDRRPPGESS